MKKTTVKKETFGEWLARLRKARGFTQAELARKVDRTHQSISAYERSISESKSGRPRKLRFICTETNVSQVSKAPESLASKR